MTGEPLGGWMRDHGEAALQINTTAARRMRVLCPPNMMCVDANVRGRSASVIVRVSQTPSQCVCAVCPQPLSLSPVVLCVPASVFSVVCALENDLHVQNLPYMIGRELT